MGLYGAQTDGMAIPVHVTDRSSVVLPLVVLRFRRTKRSKAKVSFRVLRNFETKFVLKKVLGGSVVVAHVLTCLSNQVIKC